MNVADQTDRRANQELETANNEQPDCGCLILGEQEKDTADQKPDGDQEVVDNTQHLVPAANDQLFVAQLQGKGTVQ